MHLKNLDVISSDAMRVQRMNCGVPHFRTIDVRIFEIAAEARLDGVSRRLGEALVLRSPRNKDWWKRYRDRTRPRDRNSLQTQRIPLAQKVVRNVRIEVEVTATDPDRILADKPLELGMVVARPTLTPTP